MHRSYHIWKENDLLTWLEKNVHIALDRADTGDTIVDEYEEKRLKRYQGPMPRSIARHIILSDIKGVSPLTEVGVTFIVNKHNRCSLLLSQLPIVPAPSA